MIKKLVTGKIIIRIKTNWLALGALVVLLSTALVACGAASPAPVAAISPATPAAIAVSNLEDVTQVDESGITMVDSATFGDALSRTPSGTLSDAEVESLLYMREEEKLARDVYLMLYEKWEMPIFQNISNSEQTHTDAVKTLLDRYNLEDPAADTDVGVFTDPTLQELYDQLVAEGNRSLVDALRVGAAIEEIDILDLEERIVQTDEANIQLVYENLMKGSRNHLRSFVSTLQRQSGEEETYQPQYLSQTAYDAIVNTPMERGQGRRS
jgi:hypothetical protein